MALLFTASIGVLGGVLCGDIVIIIRVISDSILKEGRGERERRERERERAYE